MGNRPPNWTFDEILLVAELTERKGWKWISPKDPEIVDLSKLLNKADIHPADRRNPKFRNPDGVSRKSTDLYTARATYGGVSTNGSKVDKEVLKYLERYPREARAEARALRKLIINDRFISPRNVIKEDDNPREGSQMLIIHRKLERDPKTRFKYLDRMRKSQEPLICEACGSNFSKKHGDLAPGFMELHHKSLLCDVAESKAGKLDDFALLCANCHCFTHKAHLRTLEDLKRVIA